MIPAFIERHQLFGSLGKFGPRSNMEQMEQMEQMEYDGMLFGMLMLGKWKLCEKSCCFHRNVHVAFTTRHHPRMENIPLSPPLRRARSEV